MQVGIRFWQRVPVYTRSVSVGLAALLIVATPALAVPIPSQQGSDVEAVLSGKDAGNQSLWYEQFIRLPRGDLGGKKRVLPPRPKDPQHAIQRLKQALANTGDIELLLAWSPALLEERPDDRVLKNLYAIGLAATGWPDRAAALIEGQRPSGEAKLYYWMAKAMVAKARKEYKTAEKDARRAIALDKSHAYAYNILGRALMAQGRDADALASFQQATKLAPEFAAAHSNLGAAYFFSGNMGAARQAFDQAIQLSPKDCGALLGRANVFAALKDLAAGIDDLQACLETQPSNALAQQRLIDLYVLSGQLVQAERVAKTMQSSNPESAATALGDIYLRRNRPAEARAALKQFAGSSDQARYLLSFCDVLEGKTKQAVTRTDDILQGQSVSPGVRLSNLVYRFYSAQDIPPRTLSDLRTNPAIGALASFVAGAVAMANELPKQAIADWRQADGMTEGFSFKGMDNAAIERGTSRGEQQYLALGILMHLKGYHIAAADQFQEALKRNKTSFLAHYFLALAFAQMGDKANAVDHLQKATVAAPAFFPANYLLAEAYVRKGEYAKAIKHYTAAARSKTDGAVLIKLGLLYDAQNNVPGAETAYTEFMRAYPDSFLGYSQLAWTYAKRGINLERALQLAQKADKLMPGNVSINDTLGWIYFQHSEYAKAARYLQQANQASGGNNADVLYHLASVQYRMGQREAAKRNVTKALSLSQRFESIQAAKKLLAELGGQ